MFDYYSKNRNVQVLSLVVAVMLGIIVGWYSDALFGRRTQSTEMPVRENTEKYDFIHPLLSTGDLAQFRSFDALSRNLHADIERFVAEGKLSSASVYFRDLETSHWMGVDEDKDFAPASLLKVALLMTYLKGAEGDSSLLARETVFKESYRSTTQDSDNFPRLEVGKAYSIADLLRRMIVYSDNDSKNTLQAILDEESRQRIFADFGITMPQLGDTGDSLSPKEYSLFFRVLYNASYLSRPLSEGALKLLSETEFKDGIVAGVPENIRVAHKFGSRILEDKGMVVRELHDCGIVYMPQHPYFLCVMTKGKTYEDLASVIRSLSTRVYQYAGKDAASF